MENTFSRATLGFIVLTSAIFVMCFFALWAIEAYAGEVWWASLLVIIVAFCSTIGVYSSTLHQPIYNWIQEPARKLEEEQRRAKEDCQAAKEREMNSSTRTSPIAPRKRNLIEALAPEVEEPLNETDILK